MSNIAGVPREKPWSRAKSTTRRKIKGCYECSRRRIDCDRTAPQCRKCLDKDYQCSGIGVRFRFRNDILSSKEKGSRCSGRSLLSNPSSGSDAIDQTEEHGQNYRLKPCGTSIFSDTPVPVKHINEELLLLAEIDHPVLSHIASVPDHLDGSTRSLLDYFSKVIAPILAVIDRGFNGYRDLFLPIAEYDPLVRKAIIIACTEHISLKSGGGLLPDRRIYNEVLVGLRTRAQTIVPYQDDISLMILLLLLLCEMISGSSGFNQIYGILRNLFRNAGTNLRFSRSDLGHFLRVQILRYVADTLQAFEWLIERRRVRLIGESLFDEAEGSTFVQVQLQSCLAFLRFCHNLHPEFTELMSLLFDLMTQASHIYVQRATHDPPPSVTIHLVERFVQTAKLVSEYEDTVGHHLLLWPYFVVGAESYDEQHRNYFVTKLKAMHRKTNCENASKAILQLEGIWKSESTTRWTSFLGGPEQIFIM